MHPRTVSGSSALRYQYEKTKFQPERLQAWPQEAELLKKHADSVNLQIKCRFGGRNICVWA